MASQLSLTSRPFFSSFPFKISAHSIFFRPHCPLPGSQPPRSSFWFTILPPNTSRPPSWQCPPSDAVPSSLALAWRLPHLQLPLPTSHLTLKPHGHCLRLDLGNPGNDNFSQSSWEPSDSLWSPNSAVVTCVDPRVHPLPHFVTPDPG